MAGEVNIPDEAWQAADEAPTLPVALSELKLIVRAAAPHIDRAARVQERRIAADKLFGLARLMASGELEVSDLEQAANEMADEANTLEASDGR